MVINTEQKYGGNRMGIRKLLTSLLITGLLFFWLALTGCAAPDPEAQRYLDELRREYHRLNDNS